MLIQNTTIWTPDNSFLLEYRARAETGEIIIGQELWQELDNLAEDFYNDRYFYDTDAASLRMDFMENCVRLTKSPYYNKPMVLMLWQKAWIEAFYSFKMAETGFDRFKKTILLIARKNTKSETSSALANSEFIVGNEGADICCSSNDEAQCSIVYDAIDLMRQLYDPGDLDTKRNQRFILNKATNTKIFKMSDRTKNKEGRNIDFAIVDETHEMKENIIGKSIEQSQSLKDNPKFINITTEGFVIDGYLDDELKKARKVITKEDDTLAGCCPGCIRRTANRKSGTETGRTDCGRSQIRHLGLSKSGNTWKNRLTWQENRKQIVFLYFRKISTSNKTAQKPG